MAKKQSEARKPLAPVSGIWWIYLVLLFFLLGQWWISTSNRRQEVTWKVFAAEMMAKGAVESLVVVNGQEVEVTIKTAFRGKGYFKSLHAEDKGPHYFFNIGSAEVFQNRLDALQEGVAEGERVEVRYLARTRWGRELLFWALPVLLLLVLWFALLRRTQAPGPGGGVNPFDFGKSKAAEFDGQHHPNVTFNEVAGLEEAKEEVREIVEFLKNPGYYTRLGARIPRGVILVGPPGTGKTLMARAVAGEAKVPFFSISGSEFVEMFVGVGASRVRDLFKKAKERAPSIVFIDEIDAIGRARGAAFSIRSKMNGNKP